MMDRSSTTATSSATAGIEVGGASGPAGDHAQLAMAADSPASGRHPLVARSWRRRKIARAVSAVLVVLALVAGFGWGWILSTPKIEDLMARGVAAFDNDNNAELARVIEDLEHRATPPHQLALLRGLLDLRLHRDQAALTQLAKARDHESTRAIAFRAAGEVLARQQRISDALLAFRQAVTFAPDDLEAYRWLAALCYDVGAMEDARVALEAIERLAPKDYQPTRLKALIFKDYERFTEAVAAYEQCLKKQPPAEQLAEIRLEYAEALMLQRRFDHALEVLRSLPPSKERTEREADCLRQLGQTAAAQTLLEGLLTEAQVSTRALLMLANLYQAESQPDRAREVLERAREQSPQNYEIHQQLASVYRLLGDSAAADDAAARGTQLRSARQQFSELHQTAIDKPLDAPLRVQLGQLAEEIGEPDLARDWYRAALGLDPKNEVARRQLAALDDGGDNENRGGLASPRKAGLRPSGR